VSVSSKSVRKTMENPFAPTESRITPWWRRNVSLLRHQQQRPRARTMTWNRKDSRRYSVKRSKRLSTRSNGLVNWIRPDFRFAYHAQATFPGDRRGDNSRTTTANTRTCNGFCRTGAATTVVRRHFRPARVKCLSRLFIWKQQLNICYRCGQKRVTLKQ